MFSTQSTYDPHKHVSNEKTLLDIIHLNTYGSQYRSADVSKVTEGCTYNPSYLEQDFLMSAKVRKVVHITVVTWNRIS